MYTHHRFDHEYPPHPGPVVPYVVCSVPRCGSSLLCELLLLSGLGGAPTEYFDRQQMEEFMRRWEVDDLAGYVGQLRARKTGPNGVVGVKVHHRQMADLAPDRLEDLLPGLRAVSITRGDHVAQAVSYSIALQTGRWASTHVGSSARPRYSRSEIRRLQDEIEIDEQGWEDWYARSGVTPLRVTYEELVADPWGTVSSVLAFLGVDAPLPDPRPEPTLRPQADRRSRRWVRRAARSTDPS